MSENEFGVTTTQTKRIAGHKYTTTLFPGEDAFDHLTTISDIIAGPMGTISSVLQGLLGELQGREQTSVSGQDITSGLQTLSRTVVDHGGAQKARELLEHTTVRVGSKTMHCAQDFDLVWQGRMHVMAQVLAWVLEVNFAPFGRDALGGVKGRLTETFSALVRDSNPSTPGQTSPSSTPASSVSPSGGDATPSA